MDEQRVSRLNEIGTVRLLSLLGNSLAAVCVLAAVGAGCTSPSATGPRDGIASGSSSAEPSAPAAPRFAAGGPDTEDYGASEGYPIGDRSTFNRIPFLIGSHSHLDQILEGHLASCCERHRDAEGESERCDQAEAHTGMLTAERCA